MNLVKHAPLGLAALAAVALGSAPSTAGVVIGDVASCSKDATGAGTCYGTQRGFRNSADPTAQADVLLTLSGGVAFVARFGGQPYTCSIASNPTSIAFAGNFSSTNQWFQISWDASGVCNYTAVWKSSGTGTNY